LVLQAEGGARDDDHIYTIPPDLGKATQLHVVPQETYLGGAPPELPPAASEV